jgi:outer membrane lipoprotein-sorting protein
MKKLFFILTGLVFTIALSSQSLDEIVKKYSEAMKSDKLSSVSTIKITGKMSAMGMEFPIVMYMKNPNKIKAVYNINGQEMVTVFDGEKGYMINPMAGSSDPVEITGEQLDQVQKSSLFKNSLVNYFKEGKLTLEGDENVNNKPAFKIKATIGTSPVYMFIDKETNLLVKTSATVEQMGQSMNVDSYPSDYSDVDGVVIPKKTTSMANGMEVGVMSFDKVEVNIPMEDSVFKIK